MVPSSTGRFQARTTIITGSDGMKATRKASAETASRLAAERRPTRTIWADKTRGYRVYPQIGLDDVTVGAPWLATRQLLRHAHMPGGRDEEGHWRVLEQIPLRIQRGPRAVLRVARGRKPAMMASNASLLGRALC
jgi:hypothetical protein